jgi:hypothetical protein
MKPNKLIKVTEEHYVIVDDSSVLEGVYFGDKKISHSFGVELKGVINRPLSEVQEAIQGYSIEQMKADFANNELNSENGLFGNFFSLSTSFESGFNASQELLKDKYVLSVDQMYQLIAFAIERKDFYSRVDILKQFNSIVLDKKEWDCYFDENDKLVVL